MLNLFLEVINQLESNTQLEKQTLFIT